MLNHCKLRISVTIKYGYLSKEIKRLPAVFYANGGDRGNNSRNNADDKEPIVERDFEG